MLVEFRVQNFRSLRDEQVLSMVASTDKTMRGGNTTLTGLSAAPALLHSAAIYGANASGKSNLIKALQYMRGVVVESATVIQPGQTYAVQPFRFDVPSATAPTTFEVTFVLGGVRFQYGFSMTSQRIVAEHLLVYKTAKPQRWFERKFDPASGNDVYEYGPALKGPKNVWESATRPNALFLSMAVQLNSDALRPVFDWFMSGLVIVNEQSPLRGDTSIQMLKHDEGRQAICGVLRAADISIANIDVQTRLMPRNVAHLDLSTGKSEIRQEDTEVHFLRFHHVGKGTNASFDLAEESDGTRSLFFLAGPVLDILAKGLTLVVDELDTSLHTLLVQELLRLFHRPETNTGGAQLIFTTHNTSLLDAAGLMRRDQLWLVEKGVDQASSLAGLSEFSPRKNEALGRGYLAGRYGAVPLLKPGLDMAHGKLTDGPRQ